MHSKHVWGPLLRTVFSLAPQTARQSLAEVREERSRGRRSRQLSAARTEPGLPTKTVLQCKPKPSKQGLLEASR